MANDEAFLKAIIEAPEDDTPRLIYADWLDEHAGMTTCPACNGAAVRWKGDISLVGMDRYESPCSRCAGTGRVPDGRAARAEFIRVQCALARFDGLSFADCPACECPDERHAHAADCPHSQKYHLRRRERELLRQDLNEELWLRDLPLIRKADGQTTVYGWRRGFVESVTCSAADWLAHGPAVVKAQPVTRARLSDRHPREWGDKFAWVFDGGARAEVSASEPWRISWLLFDRMADLGRGSHALYNTEGAALDALSAACLAYARAAVVPH